jgi:hypothetical protein
MDTHCKNCGVEIKEGSKFCVSCGTKVVDESQQTSVPQTFGKVAEKLKEHLEFLGYSFEVIPPTNDKGKPILLGKHPSEYKITFWELKDGVILFAVALSTKNKPSSALYEFANKANQIYLLARALVQDGDPTASLKSEALWIGEYSKDRFGVFIDQLRNDIRQLNGIKDFDNLL